MLCSILGFSRKLPFVKGSVFLETVLDLARCDYLLGARTTLRLCSVIGAAGSKPETDRRDASARKRSDGQKDDRHGQLANFGKSIKIR